MGGRRGRNAVARNGRGRIRSAPRRREASDVVAKAMDNDDDDESDDDGDEGGDRLVVVVVVVGVRCGDGVESLTDALPCCA